METVFVSHCTMKDYEMKIATSLFTDRQQRCDYGECCVQGNVYLIFWKIPGWLHQLTGKGDTPRKKKIVWNQNEEAETAPHLCTHRLIRILKSEAQSLIFVFPRPRVIPQPLPSKWSSEPSPIPTPYQSPSSLEYYSVKCQDPGSPLSSHPLPPRSN